LKAFTNNRVFLAKELVEYEQEIEKAIDYVFGQVVSYFSLFLRIIYSLLHLMKKPQRK